MLVMKFGGTSVGSGESIQQVASIILDHQQRRPLVVTSAMSGVTDSLLALYDVARSGDRHACSRILESLGERHLGAAEVIAPAGDWRRLRDQLEALRQAAAGVLSGREADAADRISTWGELLAVLLVSGALKARGAMVSECLEPLIVVGHGPAGAPALPDMAATRAAAEGWLRAQSSATSGGGAGENRREPIPVIPGFISRSGKGRISTLGRGGSDYSATLLAAALSCDECWIYTDVDGVLSADPRVVPEAHVLPAISAATAGRLSLAGARVLHSSSLGPAARAGIEVRVRNTFFPERWGTLIQTSCPRQHSGDGLPAGRAGPEAIAGRRNVSLVSLTGSGLPEVPNLFARLCGAMASATVEIIQAPHPMPRHDPQVLVDSADTDLARSALVAEFAGEMRQGLVGDPWVEDGLAVCSIIGEEMELEGTLVLARAQAVLLNARVSWRHQLASAGVVSVLVPEPLLDVAVRHLHADLMVEAREPARYSPLDVLAYKHGRRTEKPTEEEVETW